MPTDEVNWWDDKVILIPKGLVTADVTGEELAVYAKMKGFGPEARAGLDALATRLGWEIKKVRHHQNKLWKKGWIFLMREGANRKPRFWFLAMKPFEYPPVEKFQELGITDVPTQPWQGAENGQGDEKAPPPNTAPEAYKALQASKEPSIKRVKAAHPHQEQADNLEAVFTNAWQKRYSRSKYEPTKADREQFLEWAKAGVTAATMQVKATTYMAVEKDYHFLKRHPVWLLEKSWNELETEEAKPRDVCKHPLDQMQNVTDYGPQILGTCGVCGWKGYVTKGAA